jgi:hypothetical protein
MTCRPPLRRNTLSNLISLALISGLLSVQSATAADGRIVILTEQMPRQAIGGEPVVFNDKEIRAEVQTDRSVQLSEQVGRLQVAPAVGQLNNLNSTVETGTSGVGVMPMQKSLSIQPLGDAAGLVGALKSPSGVTLRFEQHHGAALSAVAGAVTASTQAADDLLASSHADTAIAQGLPGLANQTSRALEHLPTKNTGQSIQGALAGLGSKTQGLGELSGGISRSTSALGQNLGGQINNALGGLTGRAGGTR